MISVRSRAEIIGMTTIRIWVALLVVGASAGQIAAQSPTLVSYRTARQSLEGAVSASGGREALTKLSNLSATLSGQVFNAYQNYRPGQTLRGERIEQSGVLDLAGKRLLWRQDVRLLGGFHFDYRTIVRPDGGLFSSVLGGTYSTIPAAGTQSNWDSLERHFRPLILRRALAKAAMVRSLGNASVDGRSHEVLVVSPAVSTAVLQKIREAVPGKPIRRLVLTHYHGDHSGGARAFMAEGAEIITTAGNRGYLERMAQAPYTLNPDALAAKPREPTLVFVEGRRTLDDALHPVVVLEVGPTPHVEEMLAVYLPKEKLFFDADLFSFLVPVNETMRDFAARFDSLGLEVERIAGVHHPVMTLTEWRAAVAGAR